ncbi:MAG TPA: hypothetical protein VK524_07350 [Polyangiaceae bacterium]|nr:hypothetical protein [Polyangiaceae bacterium]
MYRLTIARSLLLCTVAGATVSAAQTRNALSSGTPSTTPAAPSGTATFVAPSPPPPPGSFGYSAACPTPSLSVCQDGNYLESTCAAPHIAEGGTCNALVQEAMLDENDKAEPSIIPKQLRASGVDRVIPENGIDLEPYYTPDPVSVNSLYEAVSYGANVPAASANPNAADDFFYDVYAGWTANAANVLSCEEYVYEKYFDLNVYHRLVGADLNHPENALSVAFGALSKSQSIGTRHLNSPSLRGLDQRVFGEFFLNEWTPKNAFFDIPTHVTSTGEAIGPLGPNLHQSIENYSDLGDALLATIEDNRDATALVQQSWARTKWLWENLMYHPPPALGLKSPTPGGTPPDPGSSVSATPGNPIVGSQTLAGFNDPAAELLGLVPGNPDVRRHLSDELNELYRLQVRLKELLRQWQDANLKYWGSGWHPNALKPDHQDTLVGTPSGTGGGGGSGGAGSLVVGTHTDPNPALSAAAPGSGGGGGVAPTGNVGSIAIDLPTDPEETIVRRRIVKEITTILDEAHDRGCLDKGLTACDWSPMSFARGAHANFAPFQEGAFNDCVKIVEGIATGSDQPPTDGFLPNLLGRTYTFVPAGDEYACAVHVPGELSAEELEDLKPQIRHCHEQQLKQEEQDAKEAVAASTPLYDDATGEWQNPGLLKEGGEEMGNKYFGLDYGYKFGWELDMSNGVCGMQAWAGAQFDAGATVFTKHFTMVDFEASLDTADSDDDGKVVDIHGEIFGKKMFDDIVVTQGQIEPLLLWNKTEDVSESKDAPLIDQRFVIVVVPVRLTAGVAGRIGAELGITAELAGFTNGECPRVAVGGLVRPYIAIDAFVEAGIDIFIASAGIRGDLTIIEAGLPFKPNVSVTLSGGKIEGNDVQPVDLELKVNTNLKLELSTLSGKLSAFAQAGVCPLCAKGKWTIVEWNGPKWSKTLFDETYTAPLDVLSLVY